MTTPCNRMGNPLHSLHSQYEVCFPQSSIAIWRWGSTFSGTRVVDSQTPTLNYPCPTKKIILGKGVWAAEEEVRGMSFGLGSSDNGICPRMNPEQ